MSLRDLDNHAEVEAHATIAADLGYIDPATAIRIIDCTDHIGRMIRKLSQSMEPSG